ncbi:MAG: 50S ribosomal protein L32 [Gammaproteobacteria bacterium]|nr:50S ribosomal protein L32 [Gammaproteobacteria bacterium]
MAVQKSRKTRSKRGMRRSHDALSASTLSIDPETGGTHRRHHITPEGFYRGRQVIISKQNESEEE